MKPPNGLVAMAQDARRFSFHRWLLWLIALFAVCGWYGYWARSSTFYASGRTSCVGELQTASWQKGYDTGRDMANREYAMESQAAVGQQVQDQVRSYQDTLNGQLAARLKQAFEAGAAAEAKAIRGSHDCEMALARGSSVVPGRIICCTRARRRKRKRSEEAMIAKWLSLADHLLYPGAVTRFKFLLSLVGVSASAQVVRPSGHNEGTGIPSSRRRPDNKECPVCGDLAKPIAMAKGFSHCAHADGTPDSLVTCDLLADIPAQNLVRCGFCNAAFWQDAEKQE